MRPPPDDKGKFETNIGQSVIDEALKSVEKRRAEARGTDLDLEASPDDPAEATIQGATPPDAVPTAPDPAPPDVAVAAPDPRDAEITSLKASLDLSLERGRDMMQKLKDEHEKLLRSTADLENYRKRAAKEKEEMQKFGNERLLKDFLPVFDNFDRALEHAKSASDFDSLKKGVEMMRKLFEDTLGKHGVKAFSAKGKAFDPTLHEAMTSAESADLPPNHVHTEVLRGFTLNDRLVRPALVVVSKLPPAPAPPPEAPAAPSPDAAPAEPKAADPSAPPATEPTT
ncbi:MAG: nucleotide exchange factor GrpE [Archangium sp.]|nr:nucleotide exchange factor GrpE [Archangium sp.]